MSGQTHGSAGMRSVASAVDQLPVLPSVVSRMLTLDPAAEGYFDAVLSIAEEDPTFAVRVIRLANSPTSAPTKPIVSVRQAVVRLGARECAALVTALSVSRVFIPTTQGQRNLWVHALQTAVAARTIAAIPAARRCSPEQAYLAGLLHDIGRFVMFEAAANDLGRVDETHWSSPQQLLDVETRLLGYDHAQLGAAVCKRWLLPDAVTELVRLHHVAEVPASLGASEFGHLLRVVQMADMFSVTMMVDPDLVARPLDQLAGILETRLAHPGWGSPPAPPALLARRARGIVEEAAELAAHLLELRVPTIPARTRVAAAAQ